MQVLRHAAGKLIDTYQLVLFFFYKVSNALFRLPGSIDNHFNY